MRAEDLHAWLVAQGTGTECDRFDVHVLASILAIALIQSRERGLPLPGLVGLGGQDLVALVGAMLPGALSRFQTMADLPAPVPDENESILRDLLRRGTSEGSEWEYGLAAMVARRAMEPHHLWQDLGLRHRRELSWMLERHFEPLARRNTGDMKWKKFFFRLICRDEGYRLCSTPVCDECDDFDACFGAEDGESLLARTAAGRPAA
ncbi:NifQ family protein [Gluconacetobacter diazotrophicus PA1 5]|uniref:Protein nifQ n=2 Tax=Gluconacetobacter diazotrophicus TaxID=33996 RepID=A9H5Y3_GLUDA|nr:nitrogen fixation protein NifQ [Gluconacetobacter diazotrophicus]ACI51340.1 NifQ family protein [Gluconacetobacter diazotrophicus PA1 5]MBB2157415.1 nitrogen fixation protein NifQ [Gluconacetobacter diazotrophicus]TWB09888.1 nitrogen fixation protein NifQ [Gluconacetobacter diazotrophicus]CAP54388.1 Protein nifQ [Gluconacetobacter diazotrophicus PA1 5]